MGQLHCRRPGMVWTLSTKGLPRSASFEMPHAAPKPAFGPQARRLLFSHELRTRAITRRSHGFRHARSYLEAAPIVREQIWRQRALVMCVPLSQVSIQD